jgi:hypothetical protein
MMRLLGMRSLAAPGSGVLFRRHEAEAKGHCHRRTARPSAAEPGRRIADTRRREPSVIRGPMAQMEMPKLRPGFRASTETFPRFFEKEDHPSIGFDQGIGTEGTGTSEQLRLCPAVGRINLQRGPNDPRGTLCRAWADCPPKHGRRPGHGSVSLASMARSRASGSRSCRRRVFPRAPAARVTGGGHSRTLRKPAWGDAVPKRGPARGPVSTCDENTGPQHVRHAVDDGLV